MQRKLLIIEDDADQRDLIRETLEDHFGAGTVAAAGSRAEAMQHDLASFDLILTDYNLPDGSGMELLADVRTRCQTPVIMVTGENVGTTAAEAIRRGATDYVVKFGDYLFTIPLVVEKNLIAAQLRSENDSLRKDLEQALDRVQQSNAQLQQALALTEELAATDPLTGLYNRRHFSRVLDQLYAEAQRMGTDLAAVMIDLDGYKQLNDSLGHQKGDEILVMTGKILGANMRRMDVAARYGGDEFVLLLPHASAEEARTVAKRIREEFADASAKLIGREKGLTMSVGIGSLHGSQATSADQLIASADAALYTAKEAGRDRIHIAPTTHRLAAV